MRSRRKFRRNTYPYPSVYVLFFPHLRPQRVLTLSEPHSPFGDKLLGISLGGKSLGSRSQNQGVNHLELYLWDESLGIGVRGQITWNQSQGIHHLELDLGDKSLGIRLGGQIAWNQSNFVPKTRVRFCVRFAQKRIERSSRTLSTPNSLSAAAAAAAVVEHFKILRRVYAQFRHTTCCLKLPVLCSIPTDHPQPQRRHSHATTQHAAPGFLFDCISFPFPIH